MITIRRLILHALAVGLALGGGLAASRFLHRKQSIDPTPGGKSTMPGDSQKGRGAAGVRASKSLETMPDDEFARLVESLRSSFSLGQPFGMQAAVFQELLRSARSSEDFLRLIEALNALPGHQEAGDHLLLPVMNVAFRRWAALDPAAAALGASKVANRRRQHEALRGVVALWIERDGPIKVLESLRAMPGGLARAYGPDLVFDSLAKDHPREALELARESKDRDAVNGKLHMVFQRWVNQDPDAVAAWVEESAQNGGPQRGDEMDAALRAFAWTDPARAWELARKFPDSRHGRSTQTEILSRWMADDPDGASRAVLGVGDANERNDFIRQLGLNSTLRDPSPAREMVARLPDEESRNLFKAGVATGIVRSGADANFREAADLALALPASDQRTDLLRELGTYWGRHDAPGASQWLAAQPPGTERDTIIGEFVRNVFPHDPTAALSWSAAISESGKRERRLEELLPKWFEKDPAAAAAWVQSSDGLSADEKARWSAVAPANQ